MKPPKNKFWDFVKARPTEWIIFALVVTAATIGITYGIVTGG